MFKGSRFLVFLQLKKCHVSNNLMDIEEGRIVHGELQDKCVCSGHFSDPELQAIIREGGHRGKCSYCDRKGLVMDMPDFITIVKDKLEAEFEDVDTAIGYNYRMSNVCAGIGRGQMIVLDSYIAHHRHVQKLYEELLADVPGVHIHKQPADARFDANFWLCAATLDPDVHIKGQEDAYKEVIKTAVGGAAGVIHAVDSATTDCQPNANVEVLRVFMLNKKIEARPTWKPMHKQPVYAGAPVYTNGVEEDLFKVGFCLPAGPYVSDEDVRYIVECIKEAMVK